MEEQVLSKLPAQPGAVPVTDSYLQTGIIHRCRSLVHNPNLYHKFYVSNAENYPKEFILRVLMEHVTPQELVPIGFFKEKNDTCFFSKRCGEAIEKLCKDNLVVPNPVNSMLPFKIKIVIGYTNATIMGPFSRDINKALHSALNSRYNSTLKELNLDKFHADKDLTEYTPLFVPRILSHILNLAKSTFLNMKAISLRHNDIWTTEPLKLICGTTISAVYLDHNNIKTGKDLEGLTGLELKELSLDYNPVCSLFDERAYIQMIKELIPKIEKLDGVQLAGSVVVPKKDFLCDERGFDFVEQFLERFFPLYDCNNRRLLEGLYHKNALFSVTAEYLDNQLSSVNARMSTYKIISRNIKSLVDYSRSDEYLFRGSSDIMKIFSSLPTTEHDPYTFTTDLIYFTSNLVVLVIQGVFKEPPENLLDSERYLGFTRTFTFEGQNNSYSITNDMLHVYNAMTTQQIKSFKIPKPVKSNDIPKPQNDKEKSQLEHAVSLITTLNSDWSKKCLEECNYDLKQSLTLFVSLYKADKIPAEAFDKNGKETAAENSSKKGENQPKADKKTHSLANSRELTSYIQQCIDLTLDKTKSSVAVKEDPKICKMCVKRITKQLTDLNIESRNNPNVWPAELKWAVVSLFRKPTDVEKMTFKHRLENGTEIEAVIPLQGSNLPTVPYCPMNYDDAMDVLCSFEPELIAKSDKWPEAVRKSMVHHCRPPGNTGSIRRKIRLACGRNIRFGIPLC